MIAARWYTSSGGQVLWEVLSSHSPDEAGWLRSDMTRPGKFFLALGPVSKENSNLKVDQVGAR